MALRDTNSLQHQYMNRCLSSRDPRATVLAERYRQALQESIPLRFEIEGVYPSNLPINSGIQPRRIAPARKANEQPTRPIEFSVAGSEIQKAMADEVMKSLGENTVIRTLLY